MQLDLQKGSRIRMLATITLVIVAIFIVRLFYLQIIRHGYYVGLANAEQLKQLDLPAKRGEIYAMDGNTPVELVLNETVYTVFADPKVISNDKAVIDLINHVAPSSARPNLAGLLAQKESR